MSSHRLPPRRTGTAPTPAAPARRKRPPSGPNRVVLGIAIGVIAAVGIGGAFLARNVWREATRQATTAAARDAMNGLNGPNADQSIVARGENAIGFQAIDADGWARIDDGKLIKVELPATPDFVAGPIALNGMQQEYDRWNSLREADRLAVSVGAIAENSGRPEADTLRDLRDLFVGKGKLLAESPLSEHGMNGISLDIERDGARTLMRLYARPTQVFLVEFSGPNVSPDSPDVARVLKSLSFYPPIREQLAATAAAELAEIPPAETPAQRQRRRDMAEAVRRSEELADRAREQDAEQLRREGKEVPWEKTRAQRKAREVEELKASATPEAYAGPGSVPPTGRNLPAARLEPGTIVQATTTGSAWYPATIVGDRGDDVVVTWNGSKQPPEAVPRDWVALPPEGFPQPVPLPE